MNISEYIASGVLELYVTGSLSLKEAKEVEAMARQHPEVAEELRRIEDALAGYAQLHSRNPRPEMRAAVMEKITEETPVIPIENYSGRVYKFLVAACIASLAISTYFNYFFYSKWSESEDKNTALLNEKTVLAHQMKQVKDTMGRMYSEMNIYRDRSFRVVDLQSIDSTQTYSAAVYWNPASRETFIDVHELPDPGKDKQYQLWALVGGKPVDAGVFEMNAQGLQSVKNTMSADAWAVTMEVRGGSDVPTMTAMYLISKG